VVNPLSIPDPIENPGHVFLLTWRGKSRRGVANHLSRGVSEHPLGRSVPAHHDAVKRLADDRVVRGLDRSKLGL
jgi:hypothetical protein